MATSGGLLQRKHWRLQACAALLAALLVTPVVVVVLNLFVPRWQTWAHLIETVLPGYVINTGLLALFVGVGVTVVGVASAWVCAMCTFPGQRLMQWALILPIAFPAYVLACVYTDALQFAGPVQMALRATLGWPMAGDFFPQIRSLGGAALVLTMVLYPYVYLLARTAFLEQSGASLESARVLGLSAWGAFGRIALPLARPAIVAGVALALMETLADYGTVDYFGVDTFSTGVFRAWFSFGDPVAASQLGALLLFGIGAILVLEQRLRGAARYHPTTTRMHYPYRLHGLRALGALIVCVMPLFLGFVAPVLLLLRLVMQGVELEMAPRFLSYAKNSVTLASLAAVLCVCCALLIAYAARLQLGLSARLAQRVAGLGYALPGVVIALGVLVPLAWLDRGLSALFAFLFGTGPQLWLSGTLIALMFAYLVRFVSIALQSLTAGLSRIRASMDDASRSLGLSASKTLWFVHAPLLARSLLTAALLVFVDVMKELPATLALRPFNVDTLAVQTYHFAKDERLSEAAVMAFALVLVGLLPVMFLAQQIRRAPHSKE